MTAPTPEQSTSEPNFPDASYSRERLELETRVLAAALRQSLEIGDTEGSSLAHEQIFLLLKASQDMVIEEPPAVIEVPVERSRQMPDIDWGDSSDANSVEVAPVTPMAPVEPVAPVVADTGSVDAGNGEVLSVVAGEDSGKDLGDESGDKNIVASSQVITNPDPLPIVTEDVADELPQTDFHVESPQQNAPVVKQHSVVDTIVDGDAVPSAKSEASSPAVPEAEPKTWVEGAVPPNMPATTSAITETNVNDYYAHLHVAEVADFASIHLSFLRQLRVLLKAEKGLVGPERQPHLKRLQKLWIAHDVLCDPVTRADYDFRKMGLRGGKEVVTKSSHGPRTQLRIGELLQCAGLLEQTELDIAADMHKAMPEMMFGTFLVRQGFIEEEDLNCVLIGQQLLKTGDITVVQFQTVMLERSASGLDIGEMLRAKGYVSASQLERAYRNQSEDTLVRMPIVTTSQAAPPLEFKSEPKVAAGAQAQVEAEVPGQSETGAQAESQASSSFAPEAVQPAASTLPPVPTADMPNLAPPAVPLNHVTERSFNFGNAAPAWKDQLDWSSPEETTEPVAEPVAALVEPVQAAPVADNFVTAEKQAVSGTFSEIQAGDSHPQHAAQASRWAAPDVVAKFASESVSYNDYDDAPYQLEVRPPDMSDSARTIAQIWQDETDSRNSWNEPQQTGNSYPFVPQAAPQFPPQAQEQGQSQAGDRSGSYGGPPAATDSPLLGALLGDVDEEPDNPFFSAPGGNGQSVAQAISKEDFVETETSGNLPSLNELEMRASDQNASREQSEQEAFDEAEHEERKRRTGDWQIMSVPATALTSLFLDEQVEPQPVQYASPPPDQTDTGPQKIYQTEVSSKLTAPEPPPAVQPPASNQKESRESRKERRRRTRH